MATSHNYTSDYDSKVSALARRRKMAELLQAEALRGYTPPPAGLAKTSIFQPLGQLAQGLGAGYMEMKANDEDAAIQADRKKNIELLLDKAQGTEMTVPGTLPHLPGVAPMTQEGAPVAPPVEGEPDLHQMLKTTLEAQTEQPGAATTGRIPLNKRDALANTMQLGEALGGTAGAAVAAKAIESGIPSAKESKKTWVTGLDAKGNQVHGWADPGESDSPTHGFTQVGGAKPEKSESEKAIETKFQKALQLGRDMYGEDADPRRLNIFAGKLTLGDTKFGAGPDGPQTISLANQAWAEAGEQIKTTPDAQFSPGKPKALAPVNLPGVPGAESAAAPTQPKMMPNQVNPAKIPAKQSEAQVLTEQLALEKGLLASGENGPDQQYIHERNIKQITERLTKIGALPPEAVAPGAGAAPPAAARVVPKLDDPKVQADYLAQDPRNAVYLPKPRGPGVTSPPSGKYLEKIDDAMGEITKQRDAKKLAPLETARASFETLLDQMAKDPKSGVIKDPATGRYMGATPGMQLDMLIPKWFQSQNAQDFAASHKSLDNIFTQMRSGLAVTSQEMQNKMKELGIDWQGTPETFWNAYTRFSGLMDAENNAIVGRYPSVVQDYWNATKPTITGAAPPLAKKASAGDLEARANAKLDDEVRKRANKFLTPGR